jgi:hypothetical protein
MIFENFDDLSTRDILKRFAFVFAFLILGIVYIIFAHNNTKKEEVQVYKEYPRINDESELSDFVTEDRKDFSFRIGMNFIGKIGNMKCRMYFEPPRFDFSGLIVGDSISKQADTNLIVVYRGQSVFKLRLRKDD